MPAALPEELSTPHVAEKEGHESADPVKPEDVRAPLKRKGSQPKILTGLNW